MPALFLYEPRMLLRTVVLNVIEKEQLVVQSHQLLLPLMETLSESTADNKIMLIGVGGAGESFFELLRMIRRMKALKVKTLVWLSPEYIWTAKLLTALHVSKVADESELDSRLSPLLTETLTLAASSARQSKSVKPGRRLTLTELDVLLQFASGLSSREMAELLGCNHKTIFSWKHNICEALELTSHGQWLEMLTELNQLSALYRQG